MTCNGSTQREAQTLGDFLALVSPHEALVKMPTSLTPVRAHQVGTHRALDQTGNANALPDLGSIRAANTAPLDTKDSRRYLRIACS